jgi:hypothetical protein
MLIIYSDIDSLAYLNIMAMIYPNDLLYISSDWKKSSIYLSKIAYVQQYVCEIWKQEQKWGSLILPFPSQFDRKRLDFPHLDFIVEYEIYMQ